MPTEEPTYTFEEVIEFIRTGTEFEMGALRGIFNEEAQRYNLFHVELIAKAFEIRFKERVFKEL